MANTVFIISGPSGVGKGTLIDALVKADPSIHLAVSATTRKARPHEVHGEDYFFLSHDEFEQNIQNDAFLEWCEVHTNYYGTLAEEVFGAHVVSPVLLEIDVQGAEKIKQNHPEIIRIFVAPPNIQELESRLKKRNTEADDVIRSRLRIADQELEQMGHYDYVVVNHEIEQALADLKVIVAEIRR